MLESQHKHLLTGTGLGFSCSSTSNCKSYTFKGFQSNNTVVFLLFHKHILASVGAESSSTWLWSAIRCWLTAVGVQMGSAVPRGLLLCGRHRFTRRNADTRSGLWKQSGVDMLDIPRPPKGGHLGDAGGTHSFPSTVSRSSGGRGSRGMWLAWMANLHSVWIPQR